jgi:cytochrome c oxidase subunit 3
MNNSATSELSAPKDGVAGLVDDWSADKQAYNVHWGKVMMWLFLVSDTFIFSCFLVAYMTVRSSTAEPWPLPSEVFALSFFGSDPIPLILIAIMTFILITSSGTMALAVNYGYQNNKRMAAILMLVTAAFGASFVGMQVFEWTKLIAEGVRPWENPWGAPQFGSVFFMVTGFHGLHVTGGVIYLSIIARKVARGDYDKKGYEIVEITGLYWHFVDLVWVFIFAFFYLW